MSGDNIIKDAVNGLISTQVFIQKVEASATSIAKLMVEGGPIDALADATVDLITRTFAKTTKALTGGEASTIQDIMAMGAGWDMVQTILDIVKVTISKALETKSTKA